MRPDLGQRAAVAAVVVGVETAGNAHPWNLPCCALVNLKKRKDGEWAMLTVTETAGARLAEILRQEQLPDEVAVRLVFEDGRLAMQPDTERSGDTTFEHEGRRILILDQEVARSLANDTLDTDGTGFMLRGAEGEE
jgi:Fe-S cluster assembly iron-binding protein IscA